MNAVAFAWRTLVRQPARATLGILGVAAVGALLFDMLLLSRGLVLSMRDLLDRVGFDVRVTATAALPGTGPRIGDAERIAQGIDALTEVDQVVAVRFGDARIAAVGERPAVHLGFFGADLSRTPFWTVLHGRDVAETPADGVPEALISDGLAETLGVAPGQTFTLQPNCMRADSALPAFILRVAGVARFPFENADQMTAATSLAVFTRACGDEGRDQADLILVTSAPSAGPDGAREAIAARYPDLEVLTNAQMVDRLQQAGFSYFRQIAVVLSSITVAFGLLLITVLLTVSVNQRLAEIAALRALGFSRRRVVSDVLCESALIVGIGGALALPLGAGLAVWLDGILTRMPGIPSELHFFVFEPRALVIHVVLLAATAILAALYPMRLVARLPIAETLRSEVTS
jgi:putative ABC transport system permease protein